MSRRRKLSGEEMTRFVKEYISGKGSTEGIAGQVGVGGETFRVWIKRYQAEGLDTFQLVKENRVYTSDQKREAVREYLPGQGSQMEIDVV